MQTKVTPEELAIQNALRQTERESDRILAILKDTQRLGDDTLDHLRQQGKQLDKIQGKVDESLYRNQIAKQQVRTIGNFLWELLYKILPLPRWRSHIVVKQRKKQKHSTARLKEKLKNDAIKQALDGTRYQKANDQIDQDLDSMEKQVKALSVTAAEMNEEIHHHQQQLDSMSKTTNKAIREQEQLILSEKRITYSL